MSHGRDRVSGSGGAFRGLLFGAAFAASLCGVLAGLYGAMNAAEIDRPPVGLAVASSVGDALSRYSKHPPGDRRVAFLGDSTAISYPPGRKVPGWLERYATGLSPGPRVRILRFAWLGLGPFDYYFMADLIARSEPDQVVIALNLASLQDRAVQAFARPKLAGWIPPGHIVEAARLPLHRIGVTVDRLLLYVSIVRAGWAPEWRFVTVQQARMGRGRTMLEKWFDEVLDSNGSTAITLARQAESHRRLLEPHRQRFSIRGARKHFGRVLDGLAPDHPPLTMLGAAVRSYTREGIDTLVYLNPINVEHLALLGILDEGAFEETVNVIERVVLESGGEFLDLHDLLPDEGFRDAPGHFAFEGEIDGPARLARALAPHVVPAAERPQHRTN